MVLQLIVMAHLSSCSPRLQHLLWILSTSVIMVTGEAEMYQNFFKRGPVYCSRNLGIDLDYGDCKSALDQMPSGENLITLARPGKKFYTVNHYDPIQSNWVGKPAKETGVDVPLIYASPTGSEFFPWMVWRYKRRD